MTSGASETIFIKFLARSSRVTGPKMRVPIGSTIGANQHRGIGIEPDDRAIRAANVLARAHDDRLHDLALLHAAARNRLACTETTMTSPTCA